MANPERSCCACGAKGEKGELIRFVMGPDGTVLPDFRQKLPGRGAYLCPEKECFQNAAKKRQFQRAFRMECPKIDPAALAAQVLKGYEQMLLGLLRSACGAGKLAGGTSAVGDAVQKGKVCILLLCEDAGGDIRQRALQIAEAGQIPMVTLPSKQAVADALDQPVRALYAVTDAGFVEHVQHAGRLTGKLKTWY